GTNGKLDEVPVEDILRFEGELLDHLRRNTKILETLRDTNVLDNDTVADLDKEVDAFKLGFQTGEGKPLIAPGSEHFDQIAPEDIAQEQIVRQKR
ncbi:MAG: F0F1 ATP synthase subunit alpha, partial [Microbacteriaceae bacterium]